MLSIVVAFENTAANIGIKFSKTSKGSRRINSINENTLTNIRCANIQNIKKKVTKQAFS
mgnify:CR=1 FL=1